MIKFRKLTMTLALLIMAVGGAWAQSTFKAVEIEVPANWETDNSPVTAGDLPGFSASTYDEAKALTGVPQIGRVFLIYAFDGNAARYVDFEYGSPANEKNPLEKSFIFSEKDFKYYYTAERTEWDLTSQDGKKWTLAEMPASNIVLQVEYEPTKVTMAVNNNAMGTVEVASGSKVEWTPDTWKGWTVDDKEHTVGDITITSSQNAYVNEFTDEGNYKNSLSFFVSKSSNSSTVIFSTTGDPFSRIEFTMINDYTDKNPGILPEDNWTFEGKNAVWEGEATKSLTLQSCTTKVSKITFFKGDGDIPDGVTVNGDGTFTVAKTATVTLKATPAEGYKFLYWDDDHTNTNPVREVTIESGMADKTYKAVFEEILYNVTFADGIEEADKWKAEPNAAAKNTEIKVTYSGTKKVIGVKAEKKSEAGIVNPVVGQVIGSDGKNYDANATLPDGVTAVAVIAYVGSGTGDDTYKNGLAIALADESETMDWSTAKSTCEGKTAIMGAKWCLPSQDQLKQMFKANGGIEDSYTGLNTTITAAGGTILQDMGMYWSSSEAEPGVSAWYVYLAGMANWSSEGEGYYYQPRACLAF